MAETLTLDILTPTGPRRENVTVPGAEVPGLLGEIGVLPGHEGFITAITPGVVRFKSEGQAVRVAVGAGFMEVTENRVVVLVERAAEVGEIDTGACRARLTEVNRELETYRGAITSADHRRLSQEHAWLEAQVRTAAGHG